MTDAEKLITLTTENAALAAENARLRVLVVELGGTP